MFDEENSNIIVIAIFLFLFAVYIYWVPSSTPEQKTKEKHVRFVDDNMNLFHETKTSIIHYIKSLFFKSHVQNGILKSTKYTADSTYAQLFDSTI